MAADWTRIRAVFEEALSIEPAARPAFLDHVCGTDDGLRREVDSLLDEHDRPGSFVGDSPMARLAGLEVMSGTAQGPNLTRGREIQAALSAGVVVGERYRIEAEVGRGGMGEVYRARDARIGRDVAIKVMPALSVSDPDRLRRFDLEARAAGALNHPNVLAIHDVGMHDGAPFIVSELLVGETLRERLKRGPLPLEKAIDYGVQIARGLVAAHEKGIVHRDLKLENLFLTKEGRVKILDFGIAKLMDRSGVPGLDSAGAAFLEHTQDGAVMGTASYMSPEQARGEPVDHRSDIFSLGVILHELVTGTRAFDRRSRAETMNAIINEEPVPPSDLDPRVSPSLERALLHCLEKAPDDRFQTARDLCFALGEVTTGSGSRAIVQSAHRMRRPWRRYALWGVVVALLAASGLAAYRLLWTTTEPHAEPTVRQLSFRRGTIPFQSARYTPDGATIVYSAAWDGNPIELYLARTDNFDSRPLDLPAGRICSISSSGEIAYILDARTGFGTLARVSITGNAPRELVENALQADWTPDGKSLAAVIASPERLRVECPLGTVVYELPQEARTVRALRVSPDGTHIALVEQLSSTNTLSVLDLAGRREVLTTKGLSGNGLAWSPESNEIFFTRWEASNTVVWAATLSGVERRVCTFLGELRLADVSPDGKRMLMIRNSQQFDIVCSVDATDTHVLAWYGNSIVAGMSDDGRSVLFSEEGEAGGPAGSVYFRRVGEPAVRLGDGRALALSPDGKRALCYRYSDKRLVLVPTGAGEPRVLDRGPIEKYSFFNIERWFPDGSRVLFSATEPGHELRSYAQSIDGGPPVPISPDGMQALLISPDCKSAIIADRRPGREGYFVFRLDGDGPPLPIPGLAYTPNANLPQHWAADGRSIYVVEDWTAAPHRIFQVELATGARTLVHELMPVDKVGVAQINPIRFSADGRSYAYTFERRLSDLLLIEGFD